MSAMGGKQTFRDALLAHKCQCRPTRNCEGKEHAQPDLQFAQMYRRECPPLGQRQEREITGRDEETPVGERDRSDHCEVGKDEAVATKIKDAAKDAPAATFKR
jgi:hypothetical protein